MPCTEVSVRFIGACEKMNGKTVSATEFFNHTNDCEICLKAIRETIKLVWGDN